MVKCCAGAPFGRKSRVFHHVPNSEGMMRHAAPRFSCDAHFFAVGPKKCAGPFSPQTKKKMGLFHRRRTFFLFIVCIDFVPDAHFEHIMKINIQSSCEIEYFVITHLCKLFVILRSRVLTGCVSSLRI